MARLHALASRFRKGWRVRDGAGFSVSGRKRPRATIQHKNSHLLSISPERVMPTPDMALLMSSFKAADMVEGVGRLEE